MNYKLRTKKAFTLIELVTAVALLALVLMFSGIIFKVSIESYRTASANVEIMQKLRVITEQLNADFKGLQKDTPLMVWFQQDPADPNQRYDQIMFFAVGDFQSTQLYSGNPAVPSASGVPVRGNVARIYYSQAVSLDRRDNIIKEPYGLPAIARVLSRRQHILTADPSVDNWPDTGNVAATFDDDDAAVPAYKKNEIYEHDRLSLAHWKTLHRNVYDTSILSTCFGQRAWVDVRDRNTFHKLMCEGVGSFAVQLAYQDNLSLRWFPSNDPNGDNSYSHFALVQADGFPAVPDPRYAGFQAFGMLFNIPEAFQINYWGAAHLMRFNPVKKFPVGFYPRALKFTFTLYDSKNVIKGGRPFTHIVYLD